MHACAVTVTGAVNRTAVIASEVMIRLSIDLRIAQVRPRVEKSVQRWLLLAMLIFTPFLVHQMARFPFSADTADVTAAGFRLHFSKHFARKKVIILRY